MLEKSYLFVDFLGVITQFVGLDYFLLVAGPSFKVVKSFSRGVKNNFCRVVEKDSCCSVGQEVAETVFLGIVYPFLDPYLRA